MNPIELKSEDGRIYAYACGRCHQVKPGHERLLVLRDGDGPDDKTTNSSLENAERCCRCWVCRSPSVEVGSGRCDDCEAKNRAYNKANEQRWAEEDLLRKDVLENSMKLSKEPQAAELLLRLMADISEDYWCAGWLIGLEKILWDCVVNLDTTSEKGQALGMGELPLASIIALKDLSSRAGGWFVHTRIPIGTEKFVTMDEWLPMHRKQDCDEDNDIQR